MPTHFPASPAPRGHRPGGAARIAWLVLGLAAGCGPSVAGGEAPDETPETNAPADASVPTLDTGAVRDGTADVDPDSDPVADADPNGE